MENETSSKTASIQHGWIHDSVGNTYEVTAGQIVDLVSRGLIEADDQGRFHLAAFVTFDDLDVFLQDPLQWDEKAG